MLNLLGGECPTDLCSLWIILFSPTWLFVFLSITPKNSHSSAFVSVWFSAFVIIFILWNCSGPPRTEGDGPRYGDREGYRGGPRGPAGDYTNKGGAPAEYQPAFRVRALIYICLPFRSLVLFVWVWNSCINYCWLTSPTWTIDYTLGGWWWNFWWLVFRLH